MCPVVHRNLGMYTVSEIQRLTGVHYNALYYWIRGYTRNDIKVAQPVILPQYDILEDKYLLGFYNLIEIRIVKKLRELGVSLDAIRTANKKAQDYFKIPHPFASEKIKIKTDMRSIFVDAGEEEEDNILLNLVSDEYNMGTIIKTYLRDIDVNAEKMASKWWPLSKEKTIVLDPNFNNGKPIVAKHLVPTEVLYNVYQAEGANEDAAEFVADLYRVSLKNMLHTIEFEESFTRRKAS